ncbi:uncharacterized protein [Hyperolius riggenbachi]|uniref:uncharacterized protein isoform X1 n=1 Tax=Hyperolius riggenbachi TaxID=752182 RepID=UPI0035A29276
MNNILLVSLICFSVISFICTVTLNAFSAIGKDGLFLSSANNISATFPLDVTPEGWTFSIWSVIYAWNGLWLVYIFSTLFRRNKIGRVYAKPAIHPPDFFALWILNNLLNIGWLFLWDRELLIFANVFLALIPVTCFLMLHMSYRNCYRYRAWMSQHQRFDLWCIRILVHNGLSVYATWTCIATIINFGIVLKHCTPMEDPDASTIALCLALFTILFWFLMETFVFEKYVRYTFTVYPVAVIASVGMFVGINESPGLSKNDLINVVIIAASSAFSLLRFALLFSCDKLRPLISENMKEASKEPVISDTSPMSETSGHTNIMAMEGEEP